MRHMDFKSEEGAVIIEATMSLSVFMFLIVTVLTIVNICYVQSKMGIAIHETAKEISQYSYLYGITGLNEKQKALVEQGQAANDSVINIIDGVGGLMDSIESTKKDVSSVYENTKAGAFSVDTLTSKGQSISEHIKSGKASIEGIESELSAIAEDPVAFIKSLAAVFANGAIEKGKSHLIAAPVAKFMSKRHFKSAKGGDCDAFLRGLGVIPKGNSYMNGIDFTQSELFPDGENVIKIVAVYRVKVVPLLPIDMKFTFCQSAETKGWFGA